MEDISEQFKRMEDEMFKLAEEFVISKAEIIALKKRLSESDRKIEVLGKTKGTTTTQGVMKCFCGLAKDEAMVVVKRLENAEEEIVTLKKSLYESNQKIEVLEKAKTKNEEETVLSKLKAVEMFMAKSEEEDVMKRLEAVEMSMVKIEGEDVMKRLEDLEKAMGKTEGEAVRKRVEAVERECQDVKIKCETLNKLQHLLNKLALKNQTIYSEQIQINKLHKKVDSLTLCIAGDIKKIFEQNIEKIKQHRILLNREEYILLGALECLWDLSEKPAWQSCKKYLDDDLCGRKAEELKDAFVTHVEAMKEYNRICADNSLLFEGSYFYRAVNHRTDDFHILAISAKNLLILEDDTKKPVFTYKKDKIKHYENVSQYEFLLVFQNGNLICLDTFDHGEEIEEKFKNVMGK